MAINVPTSPVNGDIHTAQGIQWQWDDTGGTWKCQGVTGVYSLGIASTTSLGGIKIGNNLNIILGKNDPYSITTSKLHILSSFLINKLSLSQK